MNPKLRDATQNVWSWFQDNSFLSVNSDLVPLLILIAVIGAAFLVAGFLNDAPFVGTSVGIALLLSATFPLYALMVVVFIAGMYFLYWLMIGYWL